MIAKIKRNFQVFSACDFIAPIFITVTQYIPDKRFQMVLLQLVFQQDL